MTTLVIERKKWLRGEDWGTLLRKSDGKMCCLGFYGLACGFAPDDITNRSSPCATRHLPWPEWLLAKSDGEREDYYALSAPNDDPDISEADRECIIVAEFAKHGVTVVFK